MIQSPDRTSHERVLVVVKKATQKYGDALRVEQLLLVGGRLVQQIRRL